MIQLIEIFASLHRHNVKYLLCGGLAVNLYGIPRMTADIDLLIQWSDDNVQKFELALAEHKYKNNLFFQLKTLVSAEVRLRYYQDNNLVAYSYSSDLFQAITLDVLTRTNIDFDASWERKEVKVLQNVPVYVLRVDDLITMKEFAGREQDKSDVINLRKYQKK